MWLSVLVSVLLVRQHGHKAVGRVGHDDNISRLLEIIVIPSKIRRLQPL
jgi:hypothetical protein